MKTTNFFALNFRVRFFPLEIFAIPQIECARYQNQSACINIFSGNFKEKNKSKNGANQQLQISIRSNGGNIHQTKRFENKVLDKVSTSSQKEKHRQLKRSRSHPNFKGCWKRNKAGNKSKIEQHRNSIFFCGDHLFDENILQREKESRANRNAIKNIKMEIIVRCPTCDNRQSNKSNRCCDPSKSCDVFAKKNFGQNQRKQRNSPKNNDDFSQRQFDDGVDIEKKTYRTENPANDIQKDLICFESRFSMGNHKRKQCNQSEEKAKKSNFESIQSLAHKFRDNIVCAADKHLAEKKRNPPPISIQGHKFSEIKSRSFIAFMVGNENIF